MPRRRSGAAASGEAVVEVQAACRSCGSVTVDAGDVHVHLHPCGFAPTADFLCPGCGGKGRLLLGNRGVAELVPHGALLIDAEEERLGLGPQHAAELRDLLSSGTWFDEV